MDIFRYLHFFKQSQFGFNLPKCSIVNYLKFHYGLIDDKIGECGKIYPVLCTIEVTKRCNLQCPFCIFGKFPSNWQENELTPSKFEKILNLDLIKKTLIFVFSGGEPLLNKDLPKLVYMARKRKHLVGMISNGILLNEEIAKSLAKVGGKDSIAGISDIQISIYENTKDKLSYILPKVSQYMPINPSFVLLKSKLLESSKNNFVDLIDMIIMAKESGCKSFKFNICAADIIKNDFSETISKQDDIIYSQFIEACKTKLKGIVFKGYKSDYSFLSKKFSLFFPKWHDESDGRKCSQPWHLLLDANGNTGVCCRMQPLINKEQCPNVFNDSENIVNSPKAVAIRNALLNPHLPLEKECVNCAYMNSYGSDI